MPVQKDILVQGFLVDDGTMFHHSVLNMEFVFFWCVSKRCVALCGSIGPLSCVISFIFSGGSHAGPLDLEAIIPAELR